MAAERVPSMPRQSQSRRRSRLEPPADNLQYRHFMYVTPTDEEAEATMTGSGGGLMI